jgi:DNA repair exonuclease SbcCD ATPase subunit
VQFQDTLAAGISELIEAMRPPAQTETVATSETVDIAVEQAQERAAAGDDARTRDTRDTRDEELLHLKQVINNQQDAMAELRERLRDSGGEPADVESILQKLATFERESAELQRCLEVLERENERLKQAKSDGQLAGMEPAPAADLKLGGLKSMVDRQQETISNLQNLIRELAPEAGKARKLEEVIARIQRTNDALNSCVSVLRDENALLRGELDEVNAYIAQQEAAQAAAAGPDREEIRSAEPAESHSDAADLDVMPSEAADTDEERQELEIKLQELEALLEFKDAAIEELEKQYNALEARYLAVTGEKKVD